MGEKRIMKNRKRRQRQLRRNFFLSTFVLILLCSIVWGSSFVKATSGEDTFYKYYTSIEVQEGDSLWKISSANVSEHYGTKEEYIKEVMEINHLKDDKIHAGEYLIIPYYSTVIVI